MNKEKTNFTPLSKLGKTDLVTHLTRKYASNFQNIENEIDETVSIFDFDKNNIITSQNLLIEGVDFDLSYVPLKHLGFKAVVTCISNIYGLNLQVQHLNVTLAVSNRFGLEFLEEIMEGIQLACKEYNVCLHKIDITSSNKGIIICLNSFSEVDSQQMIRKNGAQHRDLVVVSGDLGGAYLGLQVLKREKAVFQVNPNSQPDLSNYKYIAQRQLKPMARKDIIELLSALEVKPTAMSCMKDGLAKELQQLSKKSKIGFRIYEEKIPIDPETLAVCEEFQLNPMTVILNGGEDYELLFTIAQNDYEKIKGNPHLTVIGHMTENRQETLLINKANQEIDLSKNKFHEAD